MFVNTAGGGGLVVPPVPSSTHSDLDDLRSEVQQINNTNAHTPDTDPNVDHKKEDNKPSWIDQILDVFNRLVTSNDSANTLAQQNATNANDFEAKEAEKARRWSERLSKEYYQNLVKDLEKAGLNKWMAVYGMNGSGLPSAAQAHATNANTFKRQENIVDTILAIVSIVGSLYQNLNSPIGDSIAKNFFETSPALAKLWTNWYGFNKGLGLVS